MDPVVWKSVLTISFWFFVAILCAWSMTGNAPATLLRCVTRKQKPCMKDREPQTLPGRGEERILQEQPRPRD